jgi:hypothetical protein
VLPSGNRYFLADAVVLDRFALRRDGVFLEFRLQTSHRDLESAIHAVVAALAAERGVTVKATRLELTPAGPRNMAFRLILDVKAMIVSSELVARGRAEIGDDLCARVTEVEIEGGGLVAGVAKAAIEPQLAKVRGRAYPIAAFQIPGLIVRDVNVTTGDLLTLTVALAKR